MQSSLKSASLNIFNGQRFFALMLLVIICLIAVTIIQLQHKVRHLETQYAKSIHDRVVLNEDKGKLLLEKYHLTALAKVEIVAKEKLQMKRISEQQNNIQIIYLDKIKEMNDVVQ